MKLKPKHVIWGAALAFVAFKVLKEKVGGDCGCGGGATRGTGAFGTRGSTQ